MTTKTISGHYDTVFSIAHNNRTFTPQNVDATRSKRNYYCVAAGESVLPDMSNPANVREFWKRYKTLSGIYWQDRSVVNELAYETYRENMRYWRQFSYLLNRVPCDGIAGMITLLLLPLIVFSNIYVECQMIKEKERLDNFINEQRIRDLAFKATKHSTRDALRIHDQQNGTSLLHYMDTFVREMAENAQDYEVLAHELVIAPLEIKYAGIEDIYNKLYEPAFREFQNRQRPCRRYEGTYLQQIREGQKKESQKSQQSRNSRNRKTAEAIEIVFCIGDMYNTGYDRATGDAERAELLLEDFSDHLMENPNLCCITTKEMEDSNWQPPFNNGLIVLNLTVHCDEATPGVHLTCIPYSRGCKRGPAVQAAMGRAMAGMGYPSTWKDAIDEQGMRIPKRDKKGQVVYNQDGTTRYLQEPDKQGIIDWIEAQKNWLQKEMDRRYGWKREYKGSHPRGNLMTPEYKAAREMERYKEARRAVGVVLYDYERRISELAEELVEPIDNLFKGGTSIELIYRYLSCCDIEQYKQIENEAVAFFENLALEEKRRGIANLKEKLQEVQRRSEGTRKVMVRFRASLNDL